MDEPTEPQPEHQTAVPDRTTCVCSSQDHEPLRIGEKLSPSGGAVGPVYVCPAQAPAGLRSIL
ncbi:hypothetical protein ACF07S_10665 [Streptomyces sp. NPDC016640]|uniref:hypothetical protein n=1 Tax=Streptomyces sp. NPDC016640 TaxID=3364969 RepID=UPI0036FA3AD1